MLQRIAGAHDCFALFGGEINIRVLVGFVIGREQVVNVDYTREESATSGVAVTYFSTLVAGQADASNTMYELVSCYDEGR